MKYVLCLLLVGMSMGCDNPMQDSKFDAQYRYFMYCSNKLNTYVAKSTQYIYSRNIDSALYYKGKAEAMFEIENLINKDIKERK